MFWPGGSIADARGCHHRGPSRSPLPPVSGVPALGSAECSHSGGPRGTLGYAVFTLFIKYVKNNELLKVVLLKTEDRNMSLAIQTCACLQGEEWVLQPQQGPCEGQASQGQGSGAGLGLDLANCLDLPDFSSSAVP